MAVKILNILSFHGPVVLGTHKTCLCYTCVLFPQQIHTCIFFFPRLTIYYPENFRLSGSSRAPGRWQEVVALAPRSPLTLPNKRPPAQLPAVFGEGGGVSHSLSTLKLQKQK